MKTTAIIENGKTSCRRGLRVALTMMTACICMQSTSASTAPDSVKNGEEADVLNIENSYVQEFCQKANSTFSDATSNYGESFFKGATNHYSDQPNGKTISFASATASSAQVVLSQQSDYSSPELTADVSLQNGTGSYKLTNLYPGKNYYYKVTADGETIATGLFTTTGQVRMIELEKGFNIRDLGGWKGLRGNSVRYGQIYRGASLGGTDKDGNKSDITDADKKELHRLGIRAHLDLRAATNKGKYAGESSLHSYSRGETTLTDACFANIMTDYGAYNQDESVVRDIAFIIYELRKGHPVYFNCRQGADRTGIIAFVIEGLLGCGDYTNAAGGNQMALDYELTGFSGANRVDNVKVSSSYRSAKYTYGETSKLFRQLFDLNPSSIQLNNLQERCYYYLNRYCENARIGKDDLDWFITYMLNLSDYSSPSWAIEGDDLKDVAETGANVVQHQAPPTLKGDVNSDGLVTIADVTALINILLGRDTEIQAGVEHSGTPKERVVTSNTGKPSIIKKGNWR